MRLISSIKPALLLALIALIAVTVISVIETNTRERVAHNQTLYKSKQLRSLLHDINYTNEPWSSAITTDLNNIGKVTLYPVRDNAKLLAVVIESEGSQGYVAPIGLLVAISIDPDGNDSIIGTRVTHHRETPGLGDKIDIQRSSWIRQFDGASLTAPPTWVARPGTTPSPPPTRCMLTRSTSRRWCVIDCKAGARRLGGTAA